MKMDLNFDSRKAEAMLARAVSKNQKSIQNAALDTAFKGIEIIERRTAKGQGIYKPFAPYSQSYKQWKAKKQPFGVVNLELSGDMLGAMQATKIRGGAEIGFTRLTEAKKALGNNQKRRFFGFSNREKNKLTRWFYRYFK